MTRRERLARALLKPINPSVIIILGLYTVVWGFWIANPFWSVFGTASLYSAMMQFVANEYFWGGIAIAAGLTTMRGALKPSYWNLIAGSFVAFMHWFIIALFYFAGDWMNTGGITALTFAIYSGIIWLNIKVNKDHYDNVVE